jgi:Electron transfer DM13
VNIALMIDAENEAVAKPRRWRRWLLPLGAIVVLGVTVGLVLFQPWKLFIDETVNEAAPSATAGLPTTVTAGSTIPATSAPGTVSTSATSTASTSSTAPPASTAAPTTTGAALAEPAATSFRSKAHGTSGTVRLLTLTDGSRVLRIENLDTSNGPDVKVVLSPADDGYASGALSLGTLKGNKGSQNYTIPSGTDLSSFKSVVVWCKRFDVDFGVAPLPH